MMLGKRHAGEHMAAGWWDLGGPIRFSIIIAVMLKHDAWMLGKRHAGEHMAAGWWDWRGPISININVVGMLKHDA